MRKMLVTVSILITLVAPGWAERIHPAYDFTNDTVFAGWHLDGTPVIAHERYVLTRFGKDLTTDCQGEAVWELVARPLFDFGDANPRQLAVLVTRQRPGACENTTEYVAVDQGFAETGISNGQWKVLQGDIEAVARLFAEAVQHGMRLAVAVRAF